MTLAPVSRPSHDDSPSSLPWWAMADDPVSGPAADETSIRVFLLDDHEVVRRGVAQLLGREDDIEVVGEAGSFGEAMTMLTACDPDVAVLDVRLGDGSGLDICREIKAQHPEIACLILTSFADDRVALEAADAGASAFVMKQIKGNDLVDAIRQLAQGVQLLDSAELRLRSQRYRQSEEGAVEALTPQERKVFDLIGRGRTNREIGDEIFLAEKTIKNYVSNILSKLGLSRRSELAAMAARIAERAKGGETTL